MVNIFTMGDAAKVPPRREALERRIASSLKSLNPAAVFSQHLSTWDEMVISVANRQRIRVVGVQAPPQVRHLDGDLALSFNVDFGGDRLEMYNWLAQNTTCVLAYLEPDAKFGDLMLLQFLQRRGIRVINFLGG